ncbi:MAG: hypothetical protein LUD74_07020 [Tannerellaceae bacterium]|nr:hypothetical protein [Tannerellaceae bacterium]
MKNILLTRRARIGVDLLLVVVLLITGVLSKQQAAYTHYWVSPHCLFSLLWFILITLHGWQNWKMIKAFTRKKVIRKNKITAFVILTYILMFISIVSFLMDTNIYLLHYHYIIGRLFILALIVHVADKFKRFTALFKNKKPTGRQEKFSYSK